MERSAIEREVKEDFTKTYEHLLIDAFDELLHEHRRPEDNMRHAMKRMIVLQAKLAGMLSAASKI